MVQKAGRMPYLKLSTDSALKPERVFDERAFRLDGQGNRQA